MRPFFLLPFVVAALPLSVCDGWAQTAPQIPLPTVLSQEVCQECHGEKGAGVSPYVPKLAGQVGAYIVKQIHDFQSGKRTNAIMTKMAEGLDDQRLHDIAAYYSSLPPIMDEPQSGTTPPSVGRRLFQGGDSVRMLPACASCHGQSGEGRNDEDAPVPRIGGQRKAYLINQLQAWRSGERRNSADQVMTMIAKTLTDAEIAQLSAFIAGL